MKLHWRTKGILIGVGLMIPLLIVCGLTPAVSLFLNSSFAGYPPLYSADDGVMFQVWGRDLSRWVIETDWGLSFLNIGKALLLIVAVVAAIIGGFAVLSYLLADDESKTLFHDLKSDADQQEQNKS